MLFLWDVALWVLFVIPIIVVLQALAVRNQMRLAKVFGIGVRLVHFVNRERLFASALFLLGITTLVIASARPFVHVPVAVQDRIVVLVVDVSGSMSETDIQPSRLEAAQAAMVKFVGECEPGTQVAIVAFSIQNEVVQAPTTNYQAAIEAIQRLELGTGTAIGDALVTALGVAGQAKYGTLVLLTDGKSHFGSPPADAAKIARERKIPIYTVGVGTMRSSLEPLGEEDLREIAGMTGGRFFVAGDEEQLTGALQWLSPEYIWMRQSLEISWGFAALGAVMMSGCFWMTFLRV